jgi:hypothetical protein
MLTSGRLDFECDTCLMDEHVRTGIQVVQTVAAIFPYLYFGKKSRSFGRTLSVVRTRRPNGCKLEQSKLLDIGEGLDEKFSSSRLMILWTDGRPDS